MTRRFVYRCRPCEFRAPIREEHDEAGADADHHRKSFQHWHRIQELEGIEHIVIEEVRND